MGCGLVISTHAQFVHNLEGKTPWTRIPDITDSKCRFIIIGDLTGGEAEGVFEKAISRINDLAPDFVISVGDLIEGYTKDPVLIEQQWAAFNEALKKLDAPFFYVSGNHDVANLALLQKWKNKLGCDYYSFQAGKTLFLVLNTFEPDINDLSTEQVAYMLEQIKQQPTELPILVFSHDAFWKNTQKKGYNHLYSLLKKRNVTYFCGHEHRYLHKIVEGQHHYMLSELASGHELSKNTGLGEYHNLLFVTLNDQQMSIANIQLEGLLPVDVVNDANEKQVDILRDQDWAFIRPVVLPTMYPDKIISSLTLTNPGDYPLHVSGIFNSIPDWIMEPDRIEVIIPKNSEQEIKVSLKPKSRIDISEKGIIPLELTGTYKQSGDPMTATIPLQWTLDGIREVEPKGDNAFKRLYPLVVEEGWDWEGMEEGSFSYTASILNKKELEIQIKTTDDRLIPFNQAEVFDQLIIYLNPDTSFNSNEEIISIKFIAGKEPYLENKSSKYRQIKKTLVVENNSMQATVRLPLSLFKSDTYRMNIAFRDADNIQNLDPAVIWWKPAWKKKGDYPQSGMFIIKK